MFSMTPLQSWAFLILVFGVILILIWAFASEGGQHDDEEAKDLFDNDHTADHDIESPPDQTVTAVGPFLGRPGLHVIEGGSKGHTRTGAQHDEPYDWATQGL